MDPFLHATKPTPTDTIDYGYFFRPSTQLSPCISRTLPTSSGVHYRLPHILRRLTLGLKEYQKAHTLPSPIIHNRSDSKLSSPPLLLPTPTCSPIFPHSSHNVLLCQLRARLPRPLQPPERPMRKLPHSQPPSPKQQCLVHIVDKFSANSCLLSNGQLVCVPLATKQRLLDINKVTIDLFRSTPQPTMTVCGHSSSRSTTNFIRPSAT